MARDFDFKRRPNPQPIGVRSVVTQKVAAGPLVNTQAQKPVWLWSLLVILVGGTLSYFYFQSSKPVAESPIVPNRTETQVSGSTLPLTSAETLVSVYDSGAGNAAVEKLVATLNSQNFPAANLGKSQFQYDQTFIWYQPDYEKTVQTIAGLLGSKKTVLRPYQGAGPYKILIQLGP